MCDYGHWAVFEEIDIKNFIGFVYVITFANGKKYIGAKKIWKRIKAAPSTFKRGPRGGFEESDWKTYTSSSKEVNSMIEQGIIPTDFTIVGWYDSWGKTLMAEMELQLSNDVLRSSVWLNKQIGGHFNPNCFDDLTERDISRWMSFDKGVEHTTTHTVMYKLGSKTKYVHPDDIETYLERGWTPGRSPQEKHTIIKTVASYDLWDRVNKKVVHVENQAEFASIHNLEPGHLSRLVSGEIDIINDKWSLHPDISRNIGGYIDVATGLYFKSSSELESHFNKKRGYTAYYVKKGLIRKLEPESRSEYMSRLSKLNLVTIKKNINTHQQLLNSYKDIDKIFEGWDRDKVIEWVKSYIEYKEQK